MTAFEDNFLRKRADGFFTNAIDLLNKNQLDIAAFNLEQAAQLYLKHYLFSQTKDFPRIHLLDSLLEDVEKIHPHANKIRQFRNDNIIALADLGEAYLTSRYLPTTFPKEKIEMMKTIVEKIKDLLFGHEDKA